MGGVRVREAMIPRPWAMSTVLCQPGQISALWVKLYLLYSGVLLLQLSIAVQTAYVDRHGRFRGTRTTIPAWGSTGHHNHHARPQGIPGWRPTGPDVGLRYVNHISTSHATNDTNTRGLSLGRGYGK